MILFVLICLRYSHCQIENIIPKGILAFNGDCFSINIKSLTGFAKGNYSELSLIRGEMFIELKAKKMESHRDEIFIEVYYGKHIHTNLSAHCFCCAK